MIFKTTSLTRMSKTKKIGDFATIVTLIFISIIMVFPIYIMLMTAVKTSAEVMSFPPTFFPKVITLQNFSHIFETMNFAVLYKNSLFVSGMVTLGTVLSSSFVAFGFYRYRTKGKEFLFMIVLSTMMIPYAAYMIPQFILFMNIGWVNTFLPLIVPAFFGQAYSIFLFRQFFGNIPFALFESVRIDGGNEFYGFWKIALPLSGPAIAAVAIFSFIWSWDDILAPVIYLNDSKLFTLPIAMASFRSKYRLIPWHEIMAGAVSSVIPGLLLFIFGQKYFVEGIIFSGVKA